MAQLGTQERTTKFGSERAKPVYSPKKNNSTAIILGVLILLLVVVAFTRMVMNAPDRNAVARVKVVAAAQDIHPGVPISFTDIRYANIRAEYLNDSMFKSSNNVAGRVSKIYIPARTPITNEFLYRKNQTLSHTLENHERAITIKLSDEGLVDHQLFPGDRVDILVTSNSKSKKFTKTICTNVKVVTTTSRNMLQSAAARTQMQNKVTLALTPDQVEYVTHAEQVGTVKLALRNRLATNAPKLAGVSEDDLLPAKARISSEISQPRRNINLAALTPPPEPLAGLPPEPTVQLDSNSIPFPPELNKTAGWVVEIFSGSKKDILEFGAGK